MRSVRLKAVAIGGKPRFAPAPLTRATPRAAMRAKRKVFFENRFRDTAIYDGPALRPGQTIEGPAIIEEPFTTVVIYPGHTAQLDAFGTYRIAVPA